MRVLLPHLGGAVVERVDRLAGRVCVSVRPCADEEVCPRCGSASARVHSRYGRRLADVAVGGQPVVVRVRVRRFFCDAPDCPARTFAEQVAGLTSRHARRTPLLRRALEGEPVGEPVARAARPAWVAVSAVSVRTA